MAKQNGSIAVAIDKDKGSQAALKYVVEHLVGKNKPIVTLVHVKQRTSSLPNPSGNRVSLSDANDGVVKGHRSQIDSYSKDVFLPFRCFCSRKDVPVNEVILDDLDVVKALCEYVRVNLIETLVLGAPSKSGLTRRLTSSKQDISSNVSKCAPEFCTVYIINKGKLASVRSSTIPPPRQIQNHSNPGAPYSYYESFAQENGTRDTYAPTTFTADRYGVSAGGARERYGVSAGGAAERYGVPLGGAGERYGVRAGGVGERCGFPTGGTTERYGVSAGGAAEMYGVPSGGPSDMYAILSGGATERYVTTMSDTSDRSPRESKSQTDDSDTIKSPFNRGKTSERSYGELSTTESELSFVSSGRPSIDRMFPSFTDSQDMGYAPHFSSSSDTGYAPHFSSSSDTGYAPHFSSSSDRLSFGSPFSGSRSSDANNSFGVFSSSSMESGGMSWSSSQNLHDEVDAEMRKLKQELKQTMDMYSSACKEAMTAKQKTSELHRWKAEERQRLEEARLAEEAAMALAQTEKAKCKAAIEAAEAAQKIAELEAQKRKIAEMKALRESQEKKKVLDDLAHNDIRYRRYTIEEIEAATENFSSARKIGEGGYGPVYKSDLDHTPVAIKVLRPDAAQGRSQFQQEVEVLSCIRHPNMVLLLGACPESGCLVYEYMANGSLEDNLFRRGNTPPLSWQLRFRIAAEIGTGLLFLHQTKPEPLVHRDLKPGNILLDQNHVSKISDVGLARLVPPSVADSVTQYRMTSTAGTFCYIDPEYQQTGMLGTKSDIYSLGVMFLQIVTAKPPMGLTHHVESAIERGTFAEMLDPAVPDWPVEEALKFAKLALKCAELRRRDRPDLAKVVLPELNRLRALAEESNQRLSSST